MASTSGPQHQEAYLEMALRERRSVTSALALSSSEHEAPAIKRGRPDLRSNQCNIPQVHPDSIEPIHTWHLNVANDEVRRLATESSQSFTRVGEGINFEAMFLQERTLSSRSKSADRTRLSTRITHNVSAHCRVAVSVWRSTKVWAARTIRVIVYNDNT